MSKIRGKKPTYAQYKILERNGIQNTKDYLFQGIHYESLTGSKSLAKNDEVIAKYRFVNRSTGETLELEDLG